jgi:hypothetical protein
LQFAHFGKQNPLLCAYYQYLDRIISEQYTVGGVDLYVHKYLGPQTGDVGDADATLPVYDTQNPLFIEDLLLLENRDRAYDPDVYVMRGVYRQQDIDFDLTQFGLFLSNDTVFITFHYNDMIDTLGRKLMVGDVIEIPAQPSFVAVFGAVYTENSFVHRDGMTVGDCIQRAGVMRDADVAAALGDVGAFGP